MNQRLARIHMHLSLQTLSSLAPPRQCFRIKDLLCGAGDLLLIRYDEQQIPSTATPTYVGSKPGRGGRRDDSINRLYGLL